jgi:benzylsuccinate CoA-transferase BbsF subunit
MLSTCLTGQFGPTSTFAGYGNLGAALSGFYGLAGWPDRPPSGPFGAYTDYTSTHFMLATVLASLDRQRRTGLGEYIDLAQTEAALHFISPALLEASATNRITSGMGNDDPDMVPHGAFPCLGEDQWVAIAVEDDEKWQDLCHVIGRADLADEDSLATAAGRRLSQSEVDEAINSWTSTRSAAEITDSLVQAGVAAHQIQSSAECLSDPQLEHRRAFVWFEHPDRKCIVENSRFKLSRSEHGPKVRAPFLGEHTFEILSDLVGYSSEQIADLAAAEVLE